MDSADQVVQGKKVGSVGIGLVKAAIKGDPTLPSILIAEEDTAPPKEDGNVRKEVLKMLFVASVDAVQKIV